jgi:tetratricopeptide (TPR) repeat protein
VEAALQVLESIEKGAVGEAHRRIEQFVHGHRGSEFARAIEELLTRRLHRSSRGRSTLPPEELRPYEAAVIYEKAQAELKKNRRAEARKLLEEAYALDPENTAIAASLVAFLKKRGLELYGRGELEAAIQHWNQALNIFPGDVETLRFLHRAESVRRKM